MGMESEHRLTLPNTRRQVRKTELTAVSQLGGLHLASKCTNFGF